MTTKSSNKKQTYSDDFIRDPLSFTFTLLEISRTTIELGRIEVLIKLGLDTEKLFIGSKLIPGTTRCPWAKRILIPLIRATRRDICARLPLLEFTFPKSTFLLTDIDISPEC